MWSYVFAVGSARDAVRLQICTRHSGRPWLCTFESTNSYIRCIRLDYNPYGFIHMRYTQKMTRFHLQSEEK